MVVGENVKSRVSRERVEWRGKNFIVEKMWRWRKCFKIDRGIDGWVMIGMVGLLKM